MPKKTTEKKKKSSAEKKSAQAINLLLKQYGLQLVLTALIENVREIAEQEADLLDSQPADYIGKLESDLSEALKNYKARYEFTPEELKALEPQPVDNPSDIKKFQI